MVSKAAVLCSVLVVLSRLENTWCVSAASFLPYGTEHGDAIVELGTDSTVAAVSLPEAFTFLGETFSTVQVSLCAENTARSIANSGLACLQNVCTYVVCLFASQEALQLLLAAALSLLQNQFFF